MKRGRLIAATAGAFAVAMLLSCCGFGATALRPRTVAADRTGVDVPMAGSVVLAEDDTLLYSAPLTCDFFDAEVTLNPTTVTLRLTRGLSAPFACPSTFMPVTVRFELHEPLRDRAVVDGVTGTALPVFVERGALHPAEGAPPPTAPSYGEAGSLASGFGGPGSATLAEAFRQPAGGWPYDSVWWIVQTTGRWNRPPGLVTTPVTVRGHPGVEGPGVLVWTENGLTVAVVHTGSGGLPPSPLDIRAIAAHLVRTEVTR